MRCPTNLPSSPPIGTPPRRPEFGRERSLSAIVPCRGIMRLFSEYRTSRVAVMKSPFPGMDPYLERHWGDVHQALVTYIRDQLQPSLPDDLRARMQERVYIESPGMRHEYYPDVRVIERPRRRPAGGGTAVAERAPPPGPTTESRPRPSRS